MADQLARLKEERTESRSAEQKVVTLVDKLDGLMAERLAVQLELLARKLADKMAVQRVDCWASTV